MELWIPATIAAAFFQAIRFALQKRLTQAGLSATGATWARFLWAAPALVIALLLTLAMTGTAWPDLSLRFWGMAALGAAGQIFATVAVVALFGLRAFAVGLTFKKSEVLQTAFLGWLVLGDAVSGAGFAALMLGLVALLVLSAPPADTPRSDAVRAVVLGLASGAFFAVAGVGFRAATQEIAGPPLLQAGMALAVATTLQTLLMGGWFALRDRAEAARVFAAWRPGLIVAGTSLAGSMGWFLAFTGQSAAYVFALGQIELVFALLIGLFVFGERPARRELAGMALLVSSLILLVAVI